MRRTVRALSVAVLAGAACGAAGPAAARPGTTVTISVTCGDRAEVYTEGGTTSAAGRDPAPAPDGACPAAGGEQPQQPGTVPFTVAGGDDAGALPPVVGGGDLPPGLDSALPPGDGGGTAPRGDAGTAPRGDGGVAPHGDGGVAPHGDGGVPPRGDEGTGAHYGDDDGGASRGDEGTGGHHGDDGTTSRGDDGTASHGDGGTGGHGDDDTVPWKNDERPCAAEGQTQKSCGGDEQECDGTRGGGDTSCAPPGVQHGVEAGEGGAFTESVPALAAGALLIAAACGGAAYRLWGGRFRADG
ncbi:MULTISPECIES: hypothetical protein [unclassified Streptomyces]|uniref:hypothetical protein n=1 Tax=unclassified Streptomyces TaxID=2593676 RepID=UPI00371A326F